MIATLIELGLRSLTIRRNTKTLTVSIKLNLLRIVTRSGNLYLLALSNLFTKFLVRMVKVSDEVIIVTKILADAVTQTRMITVLHDARKKAELEAKMLKNRMILIERQE